MFARYGEITLLQCDLARLYLPKIEVALARSKIRCHERLLDARCRRGKIAAQVLQGRVLAKVHSVVLRVLAERFAHTRQFGAQRHRRVIEATDVALDSCDECAFKTPEVLPLAAGRFGQRKRILRVTQRRLVVVRWILRTRKAVGKTRQLDPRHIG
jgi:hypothetical protein